MPESSDEPEVSYIADFGDLTLEPSGEDAFPLQQLPQEILFDIIDLLHEDYTAKRADTKEPHPLANLRLTCKEMSTVCAPFLFRTLNLSEPSYKHIPDNSIKQAQRLAIDSAAIGPHIRHLTVQLQDPKNVETATTYDEACASILEHAPYIRSLKIYYAHNDRSSHPIWCDILARINTLEEVEFFEGNDVLPFYEVELGTATVRDNLLQVILQHHADSLRSLLFRSRIPLREDVYHLIRDTASQLHTLEFRRVICLDHTKLFCEPVVWKCASHLRHLKIFLCTLHAAHIAIALITGRFGLKLETVALWMNGHNSDDTSLRTPHDYVWAGAPLEKLDIDHFSPFEMECFSQIHTKLLVATRVESGDLVRLVREGAFPELKTVRVSNRWLVEAEARNYIQLEEACKARGLTLECRDIKNELPDDEQGMVEPIDRTCNCWFLRDASPDFDMKGRGG